jgi:hypothetical protein
MLKYFFLFCCCIVSFFAKAQPVAVVDSNKTTTLIIENNQIIDVSGNTIIYTIKGNLIFSGDSDRKEDIIFMLNAADIFSKKTAQLISQKDNKPILTTTKGKIYLGATSYRKELFLGAMERTDSSFVFRKEEKTNPLFEIRSHTITSAQLMAVTTIFMAKYKLDEAILDSLSAHAAENELTAGAGTMRRLWSSGGNEDFVWDGKILKNRWSFNDFEQWTFDGETVRRAYYDTGEDFVWDGKTLKSKWGTRGDVFEVDGNTIRKVYGSTADEFYIQGNIIKRAWTTIGTDEWEVNGELPIPIIILIVFRIAR